MAGRYNFKDVDISNKNIKAHISFAVYKRRFEEAQQWLGEQVAQDCKPRTTLRDGWEEYSSTVLDRGRSVVFRPPPDYGELEGSKPRRSVPIDERVPSYAEEAVAGEIASHKEAWIDSIRRKLSGGK